MENSQATAELKNCKIENHFCLFRPLAQYQGSDKRQALSPGVTYIAWASSSNEVDSALLPLESDCKMSGVTDVRPMGCHTVQFNSVKFVIIR